MKKLIFIFILAFSGHGFSQDFSPVDYRKIEKNIQKKKSPFFYTHLMKRFIEGDTLFKLDEKRHLYYGYIFQAEYNPYYKHVNVEIISEIFRKDSLLVDDYNTIILLSLDILQKNPFDMDALVNLYYVYGALQDGANFRKISYQLGLIIDAILSTGNGADKETAMFVIRVSDEYSMLDVLGFESVGNQSMLENKFDYIQVGENEYGLEGLYFDISPSLNHLEKLFKAE